MLKHFTDPDLINDFLGPGNLADSIFTDHTNNHVFFVCNFSNIKYGVMRHSIVQNKVIVT